MWTRGISSVTLLKLKHGTFSSGYLDRNKYIFLHKIAKKEESPSVEKLEELKKEFNRLKKEIERKRYINFELLKNGVAITDKKLGIIIEAVTPQGSSYTRKGKGKDLKKDLPVSTINREA